MATLSIDLKCNLFDAILPDVANLAVERLEKVHVTLEYWTPASQCYFESVHRHFQYLLVSLVLKLEYDYPFVFSFYGKHLVQVNYRNLACIHSELATSVKLLKLADGPQHEPGKPFIQADLFLSMDKSPLSADASSAVATSEPSVRPNANCTLLSVFLKLQKHILYEFNTLNVMKECDSSSHRRSQCKKSWTKPSTGSLKRLVFFPGILEELRPA